MDKRWNVKKKVRIFVFKVSFYCFEFENEDDLIVVLSRGSRKIEDKLMELERWSLEAGYLMKGGIIVDYNKIRQKYKEMKIKSA